MDIFPGAGGRDSVGVSSSMMLGADQRGHGHRRGFGMRETHQHMGGARLPQELRALVVEPHKRLLAVAMEDRDRFPAEFSADAGRKAFRDRLLRGETRSEVFVRLLQAETIGPLFVGEHSGEKPLALALANTADPGDFDDVATEAEHHATGGKFEIHGEVASSG